MLPPGLSRGRKPAIYKRLRCFGYHFISTVDGGYAADLDTILSSINNPNRIYDWWINGTYTADTEDTPITSVTISGYEDPAIGATAGSLSNLTVAADAPYELKTHSDDCTIWLWGGRRMKTDEHFAKNQQYNISTGLKAKDGYYFSDTCTYKLLDKSGNEVQIYAGIDCEVPNAKAADIDTPAILLGESGPVTVYNIVLDPNGGSGERSVVIVEKGSVYTIPECSFGLPEGKADFAYWKASFADGSEKTFLPGEKWTADDIMTTLTAMWSSRDVPGLWLGETPVTDANKDNILGNTGTPTASFDSETNTLTLNHPDISGLHEGALIFAKNMNLTIKAADGLTLNNSDGYGIYVKNGSLTVEGNVTGTLSRYALMADKITVRGNLDFTHSKTYGATIGAVVGDIEIDGNVKLNATSTYFADDAIAANSSVRIDGDVTVSGNYYEGLAAYGGTVTMTSGQWDISADDTAIRASDGISIPSGYTITTPAGGKISTVEIVEDQVRYHVTESDGTTVAKHVVIKPPVLTGITVTTPPDKTVYTAYEDFDPTGMVVTATYEDNSTKVVSATATVTDGTDLKCSQTSVTVSYTEGEITKTAEQSITVNPGAITFVQVKNFMAPTVGNTAKAAINALADVISLEYTPDIWPLGCIGLIYAKCNNPDYANAVKGGSAAFNAYMNEGYQDSDLTYLEDNDEFEAGNVYVAQLALEADNAVFDESCTYSLNGVPAAAMADKNMCGLFAIFDYSNPGQFTITLDPNGGSCGTASVQTGTDGKLTDALPEASAAGASFEGWYTFDGNQVTADTVFYSDTTLYAHYTANKLLSVTITMQEPAAGKSLYDMHNKWFMNGDFDFTCIPTAHAQLNPNEYPVMCFKINDPDIVEKYKDTTLTDEDFFTAFVGESYPEEMDFDDVFEKGGNYLIYIVSVADLDFDSDFVGSINNKFTRTQREFNDIAMLGMSILVEIPEDDPAITYTIIYGANSEWTKDSTAGLAFTSDAPFAKFDSVKIDDSTIAATNYTAEEGSTKITLAPTYLETLSVGSHSIEIVSSDGSASTSFTVKAAQAPDPTTYTVTFNMGGHGTAPVDQTVNKGDKATKPTTDPTAEGWTFDGWYADATFSVAFNFDAAINANTTVYAKWTENTVPQPPVPEKFTVSFNMNGHGTQVAEQTVEDGSKATKPTDPTASGYTFGGWYADATFSTKYDFNTAITANTTVYAKWTKNSVAPTDPTTPQTGDNSNMFLWIALLFVSGGALAGTAVYGKKKKYRAE